MRRSRVSLLVKQAYSEGRRLIAPLLGFPGIQLTKSSIKLAQQNFGEHYKVIKAIVERFSPDIVFPLMDLSVEANALGRFTVFPKDEPAAVYDKDFRLEDLERLREIDISFDTRIIGYVETVKLMKLYLPPKIVRGAYVTGPFTLASLIMTSQNAINYILRSREAFRKVCDFAAEVISSYAKMLMAAGAQLICILDPAAVILSPSMFREFAAPFMSRIVESCEYNNVDTVYHVCGNSMHLIDAIVEAGAHGLSLDSKYAGVRIGHVIRRVPEDVVIMGNISPTVTMTYGRPEDVRREVLELLGEMEPYQNFILSTGCDLPQNAPLENIETLFETARAHRAKK
ncbi:MAG: uroporphyrinogen decarboxylase family protein [Nitrososphaerota archaeon]|nr:uroporphyrinogen decarboxylase family protein [Candidatus Bathyarchaeota archaeon]MDW8049307.1 uroporphyrinogen decarboxylase family protein [Nitrososphaerota archaeon]